MDHLVGLFYKLAIRQNKELVGRVALLRAMEIVLRRYSLTHAVSIENEFKLRDAIQAIKKDTENKIFYSETGDIYYYKYKTDANNNKKTIKEKIKLSKYIKNILNINIDDKILGDFLRDALNLTPKYYEDIKQKLPELQEGEDIQETYNKYKDKECCMTKKDGLVELYTKNPNKVKLLKYKDVGKALIWYCDDGSVVMDRIYVVDGNVVKLFKEYARKNNIVMKENSNTTSRTFEDRQIRTVTLDNADVEMFPYLDTFDTGDFIDGKLILRNDGKGKIDFDRIDGLYTSYTNCNGCGKDISSSFTKIINGIKYCYTCFNNIFKECNSCKTLLNINKPETYKIMKNSFADVYYCLLCYEKSGVVCDACGQRNLGLYTINKSNKTEERIRKSVATRYAIKTGKELDLSPDNKIVNEIVDKIKNSPANIICFDCILKDY